MWLDDVRPFTRGPGGASAALDGAAFRPFGLPDAVEEAEACLPFGVLRTFRRAGGPHRRVLVVAPLAGGYPVLMRDLVLALLNVADTVSVTDWPNARHVPLERGRFGLVENCLETAQMVRASALAEPGVPVHVVGVCQGVVPALAATALLSATEAAPVSLTVMGGPVDPSSNPTRVWTVLQSRSLGPLEAQVIEQVPHPLAGAGRRVFPAWRQMETFALYLWRQAMSGQELPRKLAFDEGADPLRFPLAKLCWMMMDVSGDFFMENVHVVFQENALARGRLTVAERPVAPQEITRTALLTVEGADDDISGVGQTAAAHRLCTGVAPQLRAHLEVPRAGHFSLFYGSVMRRIIVPEVAAIMAAGEAARDTIAPDADGWMNSAGSGQAL